MLDLGLSAAELGTFHEALTGPMVVTTSLWMESQDEIPLRDVGDRIVSGQVTVDATADVTRVLEVTLHDPRHELGLDGSPDSGFLYADRILRAMHRYRVAALGRTVEVPIFCGPIVGEPEREGDTLRLTAHGKEAFAQGPLWQTMNLAAKTLKTDAMSRILTEGYGEAHLAIPTLDDKLPEAISLVRTDAGWDTVKALADGLTRQFYFTAPGVGTLREWPKASTFTFTEDFRAEGEPTITGTGDLVNTVLVTGGTPKKAKNPVTAEVSLPAIHPLSPQTLGRKRADGSVVPRHLVLEIEDETLMSKAAAEARGQTELDAAAAQSLAVAFDAIPVSHLEEGDMCTLPYRGIPILFRLDQFTLPLIFDGEPTSSIGYLRKIVPDEGKIRA